LLEMPVLKLTEDFEETPVLRDTEDLLETPVLKLTAFDVDPVLRDTEDLLEMPVLKLTEDFEETPVLRDTEGLLEILVLRELDVVLEPEPMIDLDEDPVLSRTDFDDTPVLSETEREVVPTTDLDEDPVLSGTDFDDTPVLSEIMLDLDEAPVLKGTDAELKRVLRIIELDLEDVPVLSGIETTVVEPVGTMLYLEELGDMLTGDAEVNPKMSKETSKLIRIVERPMSVALLFESFGEYSEGKELACRMKLQQSRSGYASILYTRGSIVSTTMALSDNPD